MALMLVDIAKAMGKKAVNSRLKSLVHRAERALSQAKSDGRNRVIYSTDNAYLQ